jgi:hypothetical protein
MKYQKPEVVVLASAFAAIRGHKADYGAIDTSSYTTTSAYQADE